MEERKGFGTTFGFLMAAVGSAVGLGNIWGFPNKMGANGGFTFLVIYLILAALCGFIVMVGELALGRKTGRGVISTYKILTKRFKWLGWLGIIAPFLILSFYCALGGYCIKYVTVNLGNLFNAGFGTGGLGGAEVFGGLLTNQGESVIYGLIFVLITLIIVMCGVSNGIEKVCSVGMPALFILLVICIIRACTLGGNDFTVAVLQADGSTVQQVIHSSALDGLKYMFQPGYVTSTGYYEPAKALVDGAMVGAVAGVPVVKHVTEIPNFISILATAGGQMFFSLSLGMGIMITYGSYLDKKQNVEKNALVIVVCDTLIALMAGRPAASPWTPQAPWAAPSCCSSPCRTCSTRWAPSAPSSASCSTCWWSLPPSPPPSPCWRSSWPTSWMMPATPVRATSASLIPSWLPSLPVSCACWCAWTAWAKTALPPPPC